MQIRLLSVQALLFLLAISHTLCFTGCGSPPVGTITQGMVVHSQRFEEVGHEIECAVLRTILEQKARELQVPTRLALLTSQPSSDGMSMLLSRKYGLYLEVKAVRSLTALPNRLFAERGVEFKGYLGVVGITMKGANMAVVAVSDGDGQATVTANRGAKGWVATFDGFVYP